MIITPIILAGGKGTRLWPASRENLPKPFLSLTGSLSLLQITLKRIKNLKNSASPIVVCNELYGAIVQKQAQSVAINNITTIQEPKSKNTAPAAALAAFFLEATTKDSLMLILPADHIIKNEESFSDAVENAAKSAQNNQLITFGIKANYPETGYGYIKVGKKNDNYHTHKVDKFVEKPDLKTAESYVSDGNYTFNSGMFLFKPSCYLQELKKYDSKIYEACKSATSIRNGNINIDRNKFDLCPNKSIDYAVMEKTQNSSVLPIEIGWSDIGNWKSLHANSNKDTNDNFISGDVITKNSHSSYFKSEGKLLATIGMNNCSIINTKDATLVINNDCANDVSKIVDELSKNKRTEATHHHITYKPWGTYEVLSLEKNYQVKTIVVYPNAKLSLQMHYHRSEHWTIVQGEAKATKGSKHHILKTNDSIYIPKLTKHRIENIGKDNMVFIEVQCGDYLGEDDIVRFEDDYGRTKA